MVDDVAGRGVDLVLEADTTTREVFYVPIPVEAKEIKLYATLTYLFFVTPPPEAKNRMQQGIIKRIRAATPQERDRILNEEIPARMGAMNTLETTNPPVIMAKAQQRVTVSGE